jgi:hypothetical protein
MRAVRPRVRAFHGEENIMWVARMAAVAAVLLAAVVPSAAQGPEPPRVSATFGAGIANPLHGDLSYIAPAWQTSIRVAVSPHMIIEGSYGEWRHTESRDITNVTIQGPSGLLGQVDRIRIRTEETRPAVGFNFLGAWASGPVLVTAGGGPGVMLFRRHYTQTLEGCHGSVPCSSTDNRVNGGSFSVQAAAGVDVAVSSRLGVFGEFRFAVPIEDAGSGQTSVVGGVRVRIF